MIFHGLGSAWAETSRGVIFRYKLHHFILLLSHENVISSVYNQDKVVQRCVVLNVNRFKELKR